MSLRLGTKLIFDNFNFKAINGEKVGIIGGEGAGKTTLLDLIAERAFPDSGEVKVNGTLLNRIIRNGSMTRAERIKFMMNESLDDTIKNKILLLDEPTKSFDVDEIERLIKTLSESKDLTLIVASNDRYFLKRVCNRTVTLGDNYVNELIMPEVESLNEDVLTVENLSKSVDGEIVFKDVSFTIEFGQKVAFVGNNKIGKSKLLEALGTDIKVNGEIKFSSSSKVAYMPEVVTAAATKSEIEKICAGDYNFLILDNPTSCLDLLTIVELENALKDFEGTIIFADSDHEFIQAIANRIINITPNGTVDRISTYEKFLANETVKTQIEMKYRR